MKKEIYTIQNTPFAVARRQRFIKTEIEEYEVVKIADNVSCLIVKNPYNNLYHCVEYICGAIVGTNHNKQQLVRQVKKDFEGGSEEVLKEQVEQGIKDCKTADLIDNSEFFPMLKG
jgi:hypothetical protein